MFLCAGVKNLLEDEAITVGGSNHSHATQDLYDAIAAGDYPEWKLLIQVRLTSAHSAKNMQLMHAFVMSPCMATT